MHADGFDRSRLPRPHADDARAANVPRAALVGNRAFALLLVAGCLVWSYWPTIVEIHQFNLRNQDYSGGLLVPPLAAYLVWRKRRELRALPIRTGWLGLGVLLLAECLRQAGVFFGSSSGERYALIFALGGAVWLAAGWPVFRKLVWIWGFWFVMVPLPARVHEMVALPLQELATRLAAAGLELFGFFIIREGNTLRLDGQVAVGVTEACSGLRMLTAFVLVAALIAFIIDRPRWHKAALLLTSIPIAVFCNVVRSVCTALFIHYARDPQLNEQFHDAAGLAMMPLAILMTVGLLRFLGWFSAAGAAQRVPGKRHEPTAEKPRAGTSRAATLAVARRVKRLST